MDMLSFLRKLNKTIKLFSLIILCFLQGCVSLAPDYRDYRTEGFNIIEKGFSVLEPIPNLYEVIEVKNVKVHIVGHPRFFRWDKAAAYGSPILGYATSNNEIWVFGKMLNGKIVINEAIVGHELTHLLNFKNSKIANPDSFK